MTVECPACKTRFPVDPRKIPAGGVHAQCSECDEVFFVEEPASLSYPLVDEVETTWDEPVETAEEETEPLPAFEDPEPVAEEVEPEAEEIPTAFEPYEPVEEEPAPALGEVEATWDEPVEEETPTLEAPEPEEEETETKSEPEEVTTPWAFHPLEQTPGEREPAPDAPGPPISEEEPDSPFGEPEDTPEEVEPTFGEAEQTFSMEPSGFETPARETDAGETEVEEGTTEEEAPSPSRDVSEVPPPMGFDSPGETTAFAPPLTPEPTQSPLPTPQFGKRDPKEKAQRLARVLVSDIILYNPDRHQRALETNQVKAEFEDEIQKSWNEYVEQVGEEIAQDTDFFNQALNEILAKGQKIF